MGVGARDRRFAHGVATVYEFSHAGFELSVLANPAPEIFDKAIKKVKASWVFASLLLMPEELAQCTPIVSPSQNRVEGRPLPCVGRFPIDEANRHFWPQLDAKAWWSLAREIAEKDNGDGGRW